MNRHFYISRDLADLERIATELERCGISQPQIHVLSDDDAGLERHRLNQVHSILQRDVLHSYKVGAVLGLGVAVIVLAAAQLSGMAEQVGWTPFVYLAIIVLGFVTWEAGLIGIESPNSRLKRFRSALRRGMAVLMVDVTLAQEKTLFDVVQRHPDLRMAGSEKVNNGWLIALQRNWRQFIQWAP